LPTANVRQLNEWYSVTKDDIRSKNGGNLFLKKYPSLPKALKEIYPTYEWDTERFSKTLRVPKGFWKDHQNQRDALDRIGNELGVEKVSSYGLSSRN